jgi:hypothetical protein
MPAPNIIAFFGEMGHEATAAMGAGTADARRVESCSNTATDGATAATTATADAAAAADDDDDDDAAAAEDDDDGSVDGDVETLSSWLVFALTLACVCAVTALFIIVTAYLFHFIENHRFQLFGEDQGKCSMASAVW